MRAEFDDQGAGESTFDVQLCYRKYHQGKELRYM